MAAQAESLTDRCAICFYQWDQDVYDGEYPDLEKLDLGETVLIRHVDTPLVEEGHFAHTNCLLAIQKGCARNLWPRRCPYCAKHFLPLKGDAVSEKITRLIHPRLQMIAAGLYAEAVGANDFAQQERLEKSGWIHTR
jgi:hypothetical protein